MTMSIGDWFNLAEKNFNQKEFKAYLKKKYPELYKEQTEEKEYLWIQFIIFISLLVGFIFLADYAMTEQAKKRDANPTGIHYVNRYGCIPHLKELTGKSYRAGTSGRSTPYQMTEVRITYDCYERGYYVITKYENLTYEEYYQIRNWGKK